MFTEKPNSEEFGIFHNQPCIRLKIRWNQGASYVNMNGVRQNERQSFDNRQISKSVQYAHVRLRSISIAIIDPAIRQEIMELSLGDLDYRQSSTETKTSFSVNTDFLQVDSHLSNASVSVILAQKRVRFMQPVLRLHALFNKISSHELLDSFDNIELVIQELDLKLEQQTIIVMWMLIDQLMEQLGLSWSAKNNVDSCSLANYGFYDQHIQIEGSTHKKSYKNHSKSNQQKENLFRERKLYIAHLKIITIKINVSFITTSHPLASDSLSADEIKRSISSNNNR